MGHWTSPVPRNGPNGQITWGSSLQPRGWSRGCIVMAKRDGPSVSSQNHWHSARGGGDGQNVHKLLSWKDLVAQFWAAFGDPWLWPSKTEKGLSGVFCCYYSVLFLRINTHQMVPAWFHCRRRRHTRIVTWCQRSLPGHSFGLRWRKEPSTDHTRHCLGSIQTVLLFAGEWGQLYPCYASSANAGANCVSYGQSEKSRNSDVSLTQQLESITVQIWRMGYFLVRVSTHYYVFVQIMFYFKALQQTHNILFKLLSCV